MSHATVSLRALPLILMCACMAYDTAGVPVPSIDGTYATTIAVSYANYLELRSDTLTAMITLRDIQGCESAEVCDVLGISEGNQRVLLHRARSKVRAHLERRLQAEKPR